MKAYQGGLAGIIGGGGSILAVTRQADGSA